MHTNTLSPLSTLPGKTLSSYLFLTQVRVSSRHLQSTPDYSPQVHKKGRGCHVHRLRTRHQPLESSTPAPESNTDTRHAVHLDTSSILSAQTLSPRGQTSRGCRHKKLLDTFGVCKNEYPFLLFFLSLFSPNRHSLSYPPSFTSGAVLLC